MLTNKNVWRGHYWILMLTNKSVWRGHYWILMLTNNNVWRDHYWILMLTNNNVWRGHYCILMLTNNNVWRGHYGTDSKFCNLISSSKLGCIFPRALLLLQILCLDLHIPVHNWLHNNWRLWANCHISLHPKLNLSRPLCCDLFPLTSMLEDKQLILDVSMSSNLTKLFQNNMHCIFPSLVHFQNDPWCFLDNLFQSLVHNFSLLYILDSE